MTNRIIYIWRQRKTLWFLIQLIVSLLIQNQNIWRPGLMLFRHWLFISKEDTIRLFSLHFGIIENPGENQCLVFVSHYTHVQCHVMRTFFSVWIVCYMQCHKECLVEDVWFFFLICHFVKCMGKTRISRNAKCMHRIWIYTGVCVFINWIQSGPHNGLISQRFGIRNWI